ITGTLDYGQGHWSPFAEVPAQHLGIPFRRIRLLQSDNDRLIVGGGTGGSKSMMTRGLAIIEAAGRCDFGVVINPLLVAGQATGGIVQGIGQALRGHTVYDGHGLLLTRSYMDYPMPRADDVPMFRSASHPVPAKTNPLGIKGCGEAGCTGHLPSVMNALVD